MKVIARQTQCNRAVCKNCGCTIEYDEGDLIDFEDGYGFMCPECHKEVYIDRWILHQFPQSFHGFISGRKCIDVDNEEIQKMIDDVIDAMKEYDIGQFAYISSGNTAVIGLKSGDEDQIIVAKNYWREAYNFRD